MAHGTGASPPARFKLATQFRDGVAASTRGTRRNQTPEGGLEPPTCGLGNRRSIQLSYPGTQGVYGVIAREAGTPLFRGGAIERSLLGGPTVPVGLPNATDTPNTMGCELGPPWAPCLYHRQR